MSLVLKWMLVEETSNPIKVSGSNTKQVLEHLKLNILQFEKPLPCKDSHSLHLPLDLQKLQLGGTRNLR